MLYYTSARLAISCCSLRETFGKYSSLNHRSKYGSKDSHEGSLVERKRPPPARASSVAVPTAFARTTAPPTAAAAGRHWPSLHSGADGSRRLRAGAAPDADEAAGPSRRASTMA